MPLKYSMWFPQSSILRPLLFFICINDLTTLSDTTFTMVFADETSIFIQGNNIHEMENELDSGTTNYLYGLK